MVKYSLHQCLILERRQIFVKKKKKRWRGGKWGGEMFVNKLKKNKKKKDEEKEEKEITHKLNSKKVFFSFL